MFNIEIYINKRSLDGHINNNTNSINFNEINNNFNEFENNANNLIFMFNKTIKSLNKHNNLVEYYDIKINSNYIVLICESLKINSNCSTNYNLLSNIIEENIRNNERINIEILKHIIYELTKTIIYLNSNYIFIEYICPDDILINLSINKNSNNVYIKLKNYLNFKLFDKNNYYLNYFTNTRFMPPEKILDLELNNNYKKYTSWSLGMMLVYLISSLDKINYFLETIDIDNKNSIRSNYSAEKFYTVYLNSEEYNIDYINLINQYNNLSFFNTKAVFNDLINKEKLDNNEFSYKIILEYLLNGYFVHDEYINEDLFELIYNCLFINADKRIDINKILDMPIINSVVYDYTAISYKLYKINKDKYAQIYPNITCKDIDNKSISFSKISYYLFNDVLCNLNCEFIDDNTNTNSTSFFRYLYYHNIIDYYPEKEYIPNSIEFEDDKNYKNSIKYNLNYSKNIFYLLILFIINII